MSISTLLFPEYRQRVLSLMLLHPEARYHVREIARLTGTSAGTLNRELTKLANEKVLLREVSGNQVYYQANRALPVFEELASILRKTSGVVEVLANALAPLANKIEAAFVFGSVGRGSESLGSDVDVLIIGEIGFAQAVQALYAAQDIVGREINPKVYNMKEWKILVDKKDAFVLEILNNPRLNIIGNVNDVK